jgi:uncharacterized BrkB/YihY/UPF0761 family membrane protein
MRAMPFAAELAAVIGLMVWIQISAVIVFLSAAWNAESSARRRSAPG